MSQTPKTISDLLHIMHALRDPDTGCPWDKAQDFSSIAPYTVEESIEVAEAIAQKDMVELKYELGDLLLQVVYHAQLAKELGAFEFADIVAAICQKMIYRHPHVFGKNGQPPIAPDDVKTNWQDLKNRGKQALEEEKASFAQAQSDNDVLQSYLSRPSSFLDNISAALPALAQAQQLTARAADVGFDWPDIQAVWRKVEEEIDEFKTTLEQQDQAAQKEELGDILFSLVNVARHLELSATEALDETNAKFRRRFAYVEDKCAQADIPLDQAGLAQLDLFWNQVRAEDKL